MDEQQNPKRMDIFSAIAAPVSGIVDGIFGAIQNRKNREFQHQMWQEQKEYNTSERLAAQQYQTQERIATQDYNSPVNQMTRLKAAGINPNTAAGQVSSFESSPMSSTGATASPQFTDQANPFDMAGIAQTYGLMEQARGQRIENDNKQDLLNLTKKQQEEAIQLTHQDIAYKKAQEGFTKQQKEQAEDLLPLLLQQNQQNLRKTKLEIDNLAQTLSNMKKDEKLKDEELTQKRFENAFRDIGIDPSAPLGVSLLRMYIKDPVTTTDFISTLVDTSLRCIGQVLGKSVRKLIPFFNP